jgi:predicted Zn-dependent protease
MAFELSKILPQIAVEADWIGLREVRETTTLHFVRKEKPQANDTMTTHGVMVEVMKNGQIGYAATNLLTPAAIQKAAERALKQAEMMANFGVHTFSADVRPKAVGTYTSPFKKPFDAMSAGEINGLLIEITKALNVSDKIINTMALARLVESETRFVSSNGSDLFQKFFFISTDFNVTAQEGSIVQRRSDNGSFARSHQAGLEMLDREIVLQRAQNIGKQAVELLDAAECPT